jgi:hypothetical protein
MLHASQQLPLFDISLLLKLHNESPIRRKRRSFVCGFYHNLSSASKFRALAVFDLL